MLWLDRFKPDKDTFGFLIRGLLILLPVGLLAGFGLYSLKKDRSLALNQATEEAEAWMRRLVEREITPLFELPFLHFEILNTGLPFHSDIIEEDPALVNSGRAYTWYLNAQGELIYPAPRNDFPNPVSGEGLDLWHQYRSAKQSLQQTNTLKGVDLLAEIMASKDTGCTPSGHRVAPLAALDWLAWNHTNVSSTLLIRQALHVLGSDLIKHPASFSLRLYEEANEFIPDAETNRYAHLKSIATHHDKLRVLFNRDFKSVASGKAHREVDEKGRFQSGLLQVSAPLNGVNALGSRWLIGWHESFVSTQLSQVLQEGVPAPYLKMSVGIDERWFPRPPVAESLATTNLPASRGRPEMTFHAWLASPDLLYQRQRHQAFA